MDLAPDPRHAALRARLGALTPAFADRAAVHDEAGSFPADNFADLRAAGLLAATVPETFGGLGLDYRGFALAVEALGGACGSTALCFTMHAAACNDVMGGGDEAQRARYARLIVEDGALWCRALTEPGAGTRYLRPQAHATRTPGGYRLDGVKTFASGAGAARFAVVNAVVDGAPGDGVTLFVVPVTHRSDVAVEGHWDAQGMRASDSRGFRFTRCFVPGEDRIGGEGEGTALVRGRPPYGQIGIVAGAVGLAQRALDLAREHATTRVIPPDTRPIARYQAIRFMLAEMAVTVEAMRLMVTRAAWLADTRPAEAATAILQAKWLTDTGAVAVTHKALQVLGGRGFQRGHPVERLVRDARASALMAATTEQALDLVGKTLVGMGPDEE